MGINRRATNLAVVRETAHYPFVLDIVLNMLKYYKRLCTSDDILLRNAYIESSAAHDQDKVSWIGCVRTILKFLVLDILALSKSKLKQSIINQLKSVYKRFGTNNYLMIKENGKMMETN